MEDERGALPLGVPLVGKQARRPSTQSSRTWYSTILDGFGQECRSHQRARPPATRTIPGPPAASSDHTARRRSSSYSAAKKGARHMLTMLLVRTCEDSIMRGHKTQCGCSWTVDAAHSAGGRRRRCRSGVGRRDGGPRLVILYCTRPSRPPRVRAQWGLCLRWETVMA